MTHVNGLIEGFILAGGESSRMGRDKALLELSGEALIVRTARLVESASERCTVVGDSVRLEGFELDVIEDEFPGAGPLGGIATALRSSEVEWNLIVACDLPYLTREWLEFLIGHAMRSSEVEWNLIVACDLPYLTREWLEFLIEHAVQSDSDAVLPMNERGAEPLCAMYHKRAESAIRAALDRGVRKVTDALADVRIKFIEPSQWKGFDSEGLLFKNMNSPADYEEAKLRLEGRQKR